MIEEQRRLDILSNNLANSNTTGYKKEGTTNAAFAKTLAIRIKDSGDRGLPRGLGNIQMGDRIGETYTDWSQGSFKITDKPADLPGSKFRLVIFILGGIKYDVICFTLKRIGMSGTENA